MQKLLTLNVECDRHHAKVMEFITVQNPDIICLQEAPGRFVYELVTLGYHVTHRHMLRDSKLAPDDVVGVLIASRLTHEASGFSYYGQTSVLPAHNNTKDRIEATSYGCILATIPGTDGVTYHIATAHPPVTPDGHEREYQNEAVTNLLSKLAPQAPHILCGDMNMPRGYNQNYERMLKAYIDEVPMHYTSSLDRTLHRVGQQTNLNAPIFDIYMVDYIFSQSPYQVSDVQLHFGVSDHAAVTATIHKP
jgi:endonuclease/exonuclease/phosphatase family metal-dependent hydrolase